jgi:hypothetical protein
LTRFLFLAAVCLLCPFAAHAGNSDTTIFPPVNQAAGGGLLYFPQGGNSSLYAVPVLADQQIVDALKDISSKLDAISQAQANGRYVPAGTISDPAIMDTRTGHIYFAST